MEKGKSIGILITCSSFLIIITSFLLRPSLFSQEADPFYLKLLTQGEKSLLAKNYREAAKELEIAAFGLHKEKNLRAKALVYLGLCHYYLRDMENCEKYMRQAFDLVGTEQIANLEKEIDESLRDDFRKLADRFKLMPLPPEEKKEEPRTQVKPKKTEPKAKKSAQKEKPKPEIKKKPEVTEVERDPVKALEKSIKDNPRNAASYYELYELQLRNNNPKDAKKTLENLVRNNPDEINGLFLLGKINFKERKFKEAEKNLERITTLSLRVQVEESVLDETKAYLILSFYLRGDREKAQRIIIESMSVLSPERISSLALDTREKEMLGGIIKRHQEQSEIGKKKRRIQFLERAIEEQPRNSALYHELYDLYQEEKNAEASRNTIQKLVRNNPDDMKGLFLLAKDEFAQNHFLEAQSHFNRILAASDKSDVNRELILKSMIYISICFHRLHKREDAQKFIEYLNNSASQTEIQRMLREEGLEEEWEKIKREK
ncbi:MAG: tetratricopeptide repeat protein [Candidatus Aminicenantes bacterium]|nr:MAG: tetratricopeptide repeat protein [Candidatus Aminicenantes bacterium]